MKKRILVIGGGGREHAVVRTLMNQNARDISLFCAPGNAGIAECAEPVPIAATDVDALTAWSVANRMDLVFVTPDDPLGLGLVDKLNAAGIRAFGPTAAGARLEGSKSFAKTFMRKYGIPTAAFEVFDDFADACAYVETLDEPPVIKADGLALGKGVFVPDTRQEALDALKTVMVDRAFGLSGSRVVIEQRLYGREVTVLAFTDGKTVVPMPASQDHKRAYDGDKGPNTGGMGAFAPSPYFTDAHRDEFMRRIALPTIEGLRQEGIDYRGVLYFGLMLTSDGIKVIEYNARLGDPETQVIFSLLSSNLLQIVDACIDGRLTERDVAFHKASGLTVAVTGGEYPQKSSKGEPISIGRLSDEIVLFHAGTARNADGTLVTNGGRVFNVTATGRSIEEARQKVYAEIDKITFAGARFRRDIGLV